MDSFVLNLEIVGNTAYKFRTQLIHPSRVGVFETMSVLRLKHGLLTFYEPRFSVQTLPAHLVL